MVMMCILKTLTNYRVIASGGWAFLLGYVTVNTQNGECSFHSELQKSHSKTVSVIHTTKLFWKEFNVI